MELKDLTEKTLQIFNIKNINELSEKFYEVCKNNKKEYLKKFKDLVEDLSIDWLQKIFQYYEADRKNKGQDYTPTSLAKLVSELAQEENEYIYLDMCAGSGALTIQKWNGNHNLKFELEEFDENVIPFLMFNMMLRNIECTIKQKDVLQDETYHIYKIFAGKEFGNLEVIK